jgi:hypothetical protein
VKIASAGEAGNALVLGQAYMRGYGDWVQLIVSSVDDTRTLSAMRVRPDINFLVPEGKRTLHVLVQLGNFMRWKEANDPQVTTELEAGICYQLQAREVTDIRGQRGVEVWIERIGTIVQYESFLKRNPGFRQGTPMTAAELAST